MPDLTHSCFSSLTFVIVVGLVSCGDGTGSTIPSADIGADTGSGREIQATERPPFILSQGEYCRLDYECGAQRHCFQGFCAAECGDTSACEDGSSCTPEGRCRGSEKSIDDPDARVDVRLVPRIDNSRLVRVSPDADGVELSAGVEGPGLPDSLRYVLTDPEGFFDTTVVRRAPVADGAVTFALPIAGEELAELPDSTLDVTVETAGGSVVVTLLPAVNSAGSYVSEVRVSTFGSIRLPLSFDVVIEPEGASLEEAETAWLALPVGASHLYSPIGGGSASPVARQLEYDALTDSYVAYFLHDFEMPEGTSLVSADGAQPQRSLRFELQFNDGVVFGSVTDRWSGFYDTRTSGGVLEPAVIVFEGELEGQRVATGLSLSEIEESENDPEFTALQPLPSLEVCTDEMFSALQETDQRFEFVAEDGTLYACGSNDAPIDSVASFESPPGPAEEMSFSRADCALALAEHALSGETTGKRLASFFTGEGEGDEESFTAFMSDCAGGVDGLCRPSAEVLCARELVAYAYGEPEEALAGEALLTDAYERLSREAFLGRQLGAFQTDAEMRLTWLQTTDFPPIVTASLRDWISGLLDDWRARVLDVHLEVVAGQYDAAGLTLLSRQVTEESAVAARRQLLFEMSQSWRAAMDTLTLAALRWNELHQADEPRAAATSLVAERTLDLYLLAGIAQSLNLRAGAGFANATFGGGFGALVRALVPLSLPFDELVYARDAEVVVSRSLDPESNNYNLLGRLQEDAETAIIEAADSVGVIIEESTARELDTTQIQNRLNNQIDVLRSELLELCGLPAGCALSDYGVRPECEVRTALGECGYLLVYEAPGDPTSSLVTARPNSSAAGAAILELAAATQAEAVAEAEHETLIDRYNVALDSATLFAELVEDWNTDRTKACDDVDVLIEGRQSAWSDSVYESLLRDIETNNTRRRTLAEDAASDADEWFSVQQAGEVLTFDDYRTGHAMALSITHVPAQGEAVMEIGRGKAAAVPSFSCTPSSPCTDAQYIAGREAITKARRNVRRVALQATSGVAGAGAGFAAGRLERSVEFARRTRAVELTQLQNTDIAEDLVFENEIARLREVANLEMTAAQVEEFQVDRLIDALRARGEAELAYARDILEAAERRDRAWSINLAALTQELQVEQAQVSYEEQALQLARLSQRAGLLQARLLELETQRSNVLSLLGSPAVVFAWANRLEQAENELLRAKTAMMNWLIAMEYYALRPFIDQRIQILLARNTYQLEEIAREMERLVERCGNQTNALSVMVSVAELLSVSDPREDVVDGTVYAPEEQFRAVLARADASVPAQLLQGENAGRLDARENSELMAAGFALELDTFANLESVCNARILSFDIAVIGDFEESARPVVRLIYPGSSTVRSCQPDLADYVAQFGPGATRFDEVMSFRSSPQSIAPLATVGGFADEADLSAGNLTLGGLPLSGEYAVLIDPAEGENREIPWDRLEDIQIRVNYTYQDFFPAGSCE